jgi:adenylyltransferase/sulfurtransferase
VDFTDEQVLRYSRHIILPEVGGKGQAKISNAKVFIVGAGGLGCPVGYYLTAAGVGTIGIVDNDTVELSNLQRQIAHSVDTLGMPKVESAKKTFKALNPDVNIIAFHKRISKDDIIDLIKDYDIVVDGSDNFPTRYLVNDACVMAGKPLVSGAILRFEGQVTTTIPGDGPCYRCLFEEPPPPGLVPSCQEAGVLGVLPGVIGGEFWGYCLELLEVCRPQKF